MRDTAISSASPCAICGGTAAVVVQAALRYDYAGTVVRCVGCDLVYLDPPMSPEEERRFYEDEYGVIFADEKGISAEDLYSKQLPAATTYLSWCRDRLRSTDSCLEIGCASGYFMDQIKPLVARVDGCESHGILRQFCRDRGYDVYADIRECISTYDRIFLWFVFEHIGAPHEFLSSLKARLNPGGEIILLVPNVNDPLLTVYDIPAFRKFYFTPAHQFYYTPESLTAICAANGLACDWRLEQRYDLGNHTHWLQHGRPGGQGARPDVFTEAMTAEYRRALLESGRADAIIAVLTARTEAT